MKVTQVTLTRLIIGDDEGADGVLVADISKDRVIFSTGETASKADESLAISLTHTQVAQFAAKLRSLIMPREEIGPVHTVLAEVVPDRPRPRLPPVTHYPAKPDQKHKPSEFGRRPWTQADKEEVARLVKAGNSLDKVAKIVRRSEKAVYHIINKGEIPGVRHQPDPIRKTMGELSGLARRESRKDVN